MTAEFRAELRRLRELERLTRDDVADLVGVKRVAIVHWEMGDNNPSRESMDKLLEIWPSLPVPPMLVDAKPDGGREALLGHASARRGRKYPRRKAHEHEFRSSRGGRCACGRHREGEGATG